MRVQVEREISRKSLMDFTRYTYPQYRANWHHRLLADKLDALVRGDIQNLLIFMPPRHGKTELVSKRLPAYLLGKNPDLRIIGCSYAASLASSINRDIQRIIEAPAYKELFPDTRLNAKNIRADSQQQYLRNSDIFETVGYSGYYLSAGVGGGITGRGFDYGFIDDPYKDAKQANSRTYRAAVSEWYRQVFLTRRTPNAKMAMVYTRWHPEDIASDILDSNMDVEILNLPAIAYDPVAPYDTREAGDALWQSQYSKDFLLNTKQDMLPHQWEAMYQQRPIHRGNALFDAKQFTVLDTLPVEDIERVRFYDTAITAKKSADYTVGVLAGLSDDNNFYVYDVYREQKTAPDIRKDIIANAHRDGKGVPIVLEGEKAGIMYFQDLINMLHGYRIYTVTPRGDKYSRAEPLAVVGNNGKIWVQRANWNYEYLGEIGDFTGSGGAVHDDQVDASSGAYNWLVEQVGSNEVVRVNF